MTNMAIIRTWFVVGSHSGFYWQTIDHRCSPHQMLQLAGRASSVDMFRERQNRVLIREKGLDECLAEPVNLAISDTPQASNQGRATREDSIEPNHKSSCCNKNGTHYFLLRMFNMNIALSYIQSIALYKALGSDGKGHGILSHYTHHPASMYPSRAPEGSHWPCTIRRAELQPMRRAEARQCRDWKAESFRKRPTPCPQ